MAEYVRPEMLRDMMPKDEGDKKPDESGDDEAPVSGVVRSADARQPAAESAADEKAAADRNREAQEKEKQYAEIVGGANTIDALKNVVGMIGTIETSSGAKMTAKEVNDWIDAAVKLPDSIALNSITRKYGLRDKVSALMHEAAAKDKEEKLEAAFMHRGDNLSAAHEEQKNLQPIGTEMRGARTEALQEMTKQQEQEAMDLLPRVGALKEQVDRAERVLASLGVTNVDEFMSTRAIGGGFGKTKDFFGGLFNKKKRELNHAADLYQDMLNQYTSAVEAVEKNIPLTPEQQAIKRVQNERRR